MKAKGLKMLQKAAHLRVRFIFSFILTIINHNFFKDAAILIGTPLAFFLVSYLGVSLLVGKDSGPRKRSWKKSSQILNK